MGHGGIGPRLHGYVELHRGWMSDTTASSAFGGAQ